MIITYPRDAAAELFARLLKERQGFFESWEGDESDLAPARSHYERVQPLPNEQLLAQLMDTAFFASITQEEGQPVAFTLLYCDPEVAIESRWPAIRFASELPLAVEQIRKLSPATDPSAVDIGVFARDGDVFLWGLVYVRHSAPGSRSYPPGLSVTSRQPGVVVVREGSQDVFIFSRGYAIFPDNRGGFDSVMLRQLLAKAFHSQRSFPDRYASAARIIDMACVALEGGLGATVLVVPSEMKPTGLDTPKYSIHESTREILATSMSDPERIDLVKSVARMAFVDGALLLDECGVLLGAGTMIRTEQTPDFEVVVVNPAAPTNPPVRLPLSGFGGGARHRSSLVFCYLNPGTLALVVSHDGVMSVMTRPLEEDSVVVLRPFLRGSDLGIWRGLTLRSSGPPPAAAELKR